LPERERVFVLEHGELNFFSSPARHVVPTIGLRIEVGNGKQTVVYSSDTEPCESIVRLAQGADVLIHEAGGEMVGHSSARQAGSVAQEANVGRLMLIHYPTREGNPEELLGEAQDVYDGEVVLAEDFMEIELG
jgi:ribonuclease Z